MKDFLKKLLDKERWKKLFSAETRKKLLVWEKPQKIAAAAAGGVLVLILALVLWGNLASGNTVDAIRAAKFDDALSQYQAMNGVSRWLSSGRVESELDDILPQTEYASAENQLEQLNQLAQACDTDEDGEGGTVLRYWNAMSEGDFASAAELLEQMEDEAAQAQKKSGAQALTAYVLSQSYTARAEDELVSSAAMQNYKDCETFLHKVGDERFEPQVLAQIMQIFTLGNYEKYNPIYGLFKATHDTVDEADERLQTGLSYLEQGDVKSAKAYFNSTVTLLQEAEALCAETDNEKIWVEDYSAAISGLSEAAEQLRDQALADGFARMTDYNSAQKVYQNVCSKIIDIIMEAAPLFPAQQP